LTTFGCSEEQIQQDIEGLEKIVLPVISKKINFLDSQHYTKVSEQLNRINGKLEEQGNSERNTEGDIVIVTQEVVLTEYDSTHTYTFKVLRVQPMAAIENLVLHYNLDTQEYDEYLVQYYFNGDELLELSDSG